MSCRTFLSRLSLCYRDVLEEQEYFQIKMPLLKAFFQYLIVVLTGILIPYSIRYFIKHVYPQSIILVCLIPVGFILFLFRGRFRAYMEYFLLIYLIMIIGLLATVFRDLIPDESSRTTFYAGYAFSMVHRLVGYNVLRFRCMVVLYIASLALKFPLIHCSDTLLIIIVVILDVVTVFLCFIAEKNDRSLFDSLYRSKKDILKFKQLLTQYLPNQMAIFSSDYDNVAYMNNAFKRTFKCRNTIQTKSALEKLIIEKEVLTKNRTLFTHLGCFDNGEVDELNLSQLMINLSRNSEIIRDIGNINFTVIEEVKTDIIQAEEQPVEDAADVIASEPCRSGAFRRFINRILRRRSRPAINTSQNIRHEDANESIGSLDRHSSRSASSDILIDEATRKVYKVRIFPLLWDDVEAVAMFMDDVTKQKIISELKIADKNKDLVIATVSHELRTPLNGMLGLIDIAMKAVKQEEILAYLKACRNSGFLMLNLVNSILDMNQIKNKNLRLVFSKIAIPEFIEEIKGLFESYCSSRNVYLKGVIGESLPKYLITDRNRLSQILVNLLGNAFKFTFKGGVTIQAELESNDPYRVKFSISDTGIGISQADQQRLFKMYGMIEQKDRNINSHGIGLGLTISNQLATLLNQPSNKGIEVESEVDIGTTFSFVVQSQNPEVSSLHEIDIRNASASELNSESMQENRDDNVCRKMTIYENVNTGNFSKVTSFNPSTNHNTVTNLTTETKNGSNKLKKNLIITKSEEYGDISIVKPKLIDRDYVEAREANFGKESQQLEIEEQKVEDVDENEEESVLDQESWCLVVDDNPFNLMVACHIMKERKYQVKTALNGREAINQVIQHTKENNKFKVILMDCQMPVMDGYEATRKITKMMKDGEISECPIIAVTANNRDDKHDKLCQEVGMSGHVNKPLQVAELELILKKVQKNGRQF